MLAGQTGRQQGSRSRNQGESSGARDEPAVHRGRHTGWRITSIRSIADELNQRGILAPRAGDWQPTTGVRLLARLSVQKDINSSP